MNLLQRLRSLTAPSVSLQKLTTSSTAHITQPAVSKPTSTLRTLKLVMVTAENNNKFYEMRENNNDTFTVQYGRIGSSYNTVTYPMAHWDKKFREKIAKGYVDQTHLYATKSADTDASSIENPEVRALMERLLNLAKQSIYQNYVVTAQQVTQKQIETAQQLLDKLANLATIGVDLNTFNATFLELFKIIPRKMGKVGEHLLNTSPQTADELQTLRNQLASEQDTLDVMRGQVELNQPDDAERSPKTLLDAMNLAIEPVTDKRVLNLIKRMMGSDADKFESAFSVCQTNTQTQFDTYVSQRANKKTQLLWHGSRSENWMSILKTGLVLRPTNAIITGKMFGYGVYFADQFSKSLNYTSFQGSTWANGRQQEGYLAIYEVHVGKQLKITKHEGNHMQLNSQKLNALGGQYDSVFAQRGMSLQKNEFIVYNQAQCTIRYMVKIKI